VRKALGEAAESASLIRTVPRYGYAFAGEAVVERTTEPGVSRYMLVAHDADFVLPAGEVLIGRGPECAVRLHSSGVSRVHARVQVGEIRVMLEDQGSKNGTWVNGARVARPVELQEGDEVLIGTDRLVFRSSASMEATKTATPR
jgi:pSer/pThr/pTyr-binding forkhead associated (FHA) protein